MKIHRRKRRRPRMAPSRRPIHSTTVPTMVKTAPIQTITTAASTTIHTAMDTTTTSGSNTVPRTAAMDSGTRARVPALAPVVTVALATTELFQLFVFFFLFYVSWYMSNHSTVSLHSANFSCDMKMMILWQNNSFPIPIDLLKYYISTVGNRKLGFLKFWEYANHFTYYFSFVRPFTCTSDWIIIFNRTLILYILHFQVQISS